MKRVFYTLLIVAMMLCLVPTQAMAADDKEVIHFPDGSHTTVEIFYQGTRASKTVTGSKVSSHYGSNGSLVWKATLTGHFTYTGSSATCTSSSASVTIYDSSWYTISKSSSKSGDTAYAQITMGQKLAGVTVQKISADMSLTCSADGKLS